MRRTIQGLVATVSLAIFALPAASTDMPIAEARGLIDQATQLVGSDRMQLGSGPQGAKSVDAAHTARVGQLLAQIGALELQLERGDARLDGASVDALKRARWALEAEPFYVPQAKAMAAAKALTTLSGSVRRASDNAALAGVNMLATEFTWRTSPSGAGITASANTDAAGAYTLTLPPGNYLVRANPSSAPGSVTPAVTGGYRRMVYNGIACEDQNVCEAHVGTVIALASGTPVSGIDFSLLAGAGVSGTVTRASNATAVANVFVSVRNQRDGIFSGAATDASGNYSVVGLPPGSYRVEVKVDSTTGLMGEVFNNRPCGFDDCQYIPADPVTLAVGSVLSGRNLSLDGNPGTIQGVVQNDLGAAIAFADLSLSSDDGYSALSATSDASGNFSFTQLRPGTYRLQGSGITTNGAVSPAIRVFGSTHTPTFWPNLACPTGCPGEFGAPISVTAGSTVSLPQPLRMNRGFAVQGQIRRAGALTPLAGVGVRVTGARGFGSATTDASGNYAIAGLSAGTYFPV